MFSTLKLGYEAALERANEVYVDLLALLIVIMAAVVVMFFLNIADLSGVNVIIGVLVMILIWPAIIKPALLPPVAAAGFVVYGLSGQDKSDGAKESLALLAKLVRALGLSFGFIALALSPLWSFQNDPGAFWLLFLIGLLVAYLDPARPRRTVG